jgi:hypothetical protein
VFTIAKDGTPTLQDGGLLVRWNEVEYAQVFGE